MFASPISLRNSVTFWSNLSWPDSMQLACLIVWMRMRFSPLVFLAPSGGFVLAISTAVGLSPTGTLRCLSIFAAADDEMTLAARLGAGAASAGGAGFFTGGSGMVMVS